MQIWSKMLLSLFLLGACRSNLRLNTKTIATDQPCNAGESCNENHVATESQTNSEESFLVLHFETDKNENSDQSLITSAETLAVLWDTSKDLTKIDLIIAKDQFCRDQIFNFRDLVTNIKPLDFLTDGRYFICATSKNADDREIKANNDGIGLTLDRTPPVLNGARIMKSNQSILNPVLTVDDLTDVSFKWSVKQGIANHEISDGTVLNPSFNFNQDGTVIYDLQLTDAAGNVTHADIDLSRDTVAPVILVTNPVINAAIPFVLKADSIVGADSVEWHVLTKPTNGTVNFSDFRVPEVTASFSGDGVYTVELTVSDLAGNQSSVTFTVNWYGSLSPPMPTISGVPSGSSNLTNIVVGFGGDPITAYQWVLLNGNAVCQGATYSTWTPVSTPLNIATGADGGKKLCLQTRNVDAIGLIASQEFTWNQDTVIPANVTLSNLPNINSNSTTLNIGVQGADASEYHAAIINGAANCSSATYGGWVIISTPITNAPGSDGFWKLCVEGRDAAHNVQATATEYAWTLDTVAPIYTSMTLVNEAADAVITLPEVGSMLPIATLTAANYTSVKYSNVLLDSPAVTCNGSIAYGNTVIPAINSIPAVDEIYAICVELRDDAGNITWGKSPSLTRDAAPPQFTSLNLANGASDGFINLAESTSALAVATLTASGYNSATYTAILDDSPPIVCDASKTYSNSAIPLINSVSADGTYALCVKLADSSGNITYGKSATVVRETVPPVFVSLNGANGASDSYVNASEYLSNLSLLTLNASGYNTVSYTSILTSTVTCDGSETYGNSAIPLISDIPGADGDYAVCVKLVDTAVNTVYGKSQIIHRDITAPTFTSLAGANGGSDGYINSAESTSNLAIAALTAANYVSADYTSLLDNSSSITCDGLQTYGLATIPLINSLTTDGTYAFCVRLTDAAGNVTFGKSVSFIRDIVLPVFTSLNGANEAADLYVNAAEYLSTSPLYSLTASGFVSATYSDVLASAVTCDGSATYNNSGVPNINQIPAVDASYAVCVKLVDAANNTTYGKSQTVIRDIGLPSFVSLNAANEASDGYINLAESTSTNLFATLNASGYTIVNYTAILDDSTPVTCDGSKTYGNSSIPVINSIGTDGTYALCVKLADDAGNVIYGKSSQVIRDTGNPTFTSLLGANEAANGYVNLSESTSTQPAFALTASGFVTVTYTNILVDNPAITCNAGKTYSQGSIPLVNSMTSDDYYALCVKMVDAAGNITFGKSQQIIRDTVPRAITSISHIYLATSDGYVNAGEASAALNVYGVNSSGAVYDSPMVIDFTPWLSSAVTCDSSQTYSLSGTPKINQNVSGDGSYTSCVRVTDAAGNITYGKAPTLVWDTVAPSFTSLVGANEAADGVLNVSDLTSSLAIATLNAANYDTAVYSDILDNTPSITCDNGKTYGNSSIPLINTTPAVDDTYAVCVKLYDLAGNVTFGKSVSFVRDGTPPSFVSLNLSNEAANGYINNAEASSALAFATLSASGYTGVAYTSILDDSTPITCDGSKTYGNSSIPAINSISSDGTYALCVKLTDSVGNVTYGKSPQAIRDVVAPVFTSLNGANGAVDGYVNASEYLSPAAMFSLSASGANTADYTSILASSVTCDGAQIYGSASIPLISDLPGSDGTYAVCVKLRDLSGNTTYGKSQVITRDIAAPTLTSLALANEASDGFVNATESTSVLAFATLTASGYTTADYTVILDDATPVTCDGSKTYSNSSVPAINSIAATNSTYALCVKLADAAGNMTYGKSPAATKDTVAPTFTTLVGANGASDGYINNSEYLSPATLLTLTASGYTGANYTAVLVDSPITCDGSQTYSNGSIPLISDIPGSDNSYAVCVKLTDASGNITFGKSSTIVRDITAPVFTSLVAANGASDGYVNSSEASSGADFAVLTASGQSSTNYTAILVDSPVTCDSGQTYSNSSVPVISTMGADNTYALCVKLADAAGNISYGKSSSVVKDTVAPVFTSLNGANEASDGYITVAENTSTLAVAALVASGQSATAYTDLLDDSTSITCNAGKTYGNGAIPAINTMTVNGVYALCVRLTDSAGNITFGKSQTIHRIGPPPPAATALTMTRGNTQLSLAWTTGGGTTSGFIVVRSLTPTGTSSASVNAFVPDLGVTYTTGQTLTVSGITDQLYVIYSGSSASVTDSSLTNDTRYYYTVIAFDSDHQYSAKIYGDAEPKSIHQKLTTVGKYTNAAITAVEKISNRGNYLYYDNYWDGLGIIDISNRTSPVKRGSLTLTQKVHQFIPYDNTYGLAANDLNGLAVINITNPDSLTLVNTIDTVGKSLAVATKNNYAFVADEANGLVIFSLANPAAPSIVATVPLLDAEDLAIQGNYVYVANGANGLAIIDITDPLNPVAKGTFNDSASIYWADSIRVNGSHVYMFDYTNWNFYDLNITDPNAPTLVKKFYTGESSSGVCVDALHNHVFTASGSYGLHMWEIGAPSLKMVSSAANDWSYVDDCVVVGEYIYAANWDNLGIFYDKSVETNYPASSIYQYGIALDATSDGTYTYVADGGNATIYNTSNPLSPSYVSQIPAGTWIRGVALDSAGQKLYTADMGAGVKIYDITNKASPTLLGSYATTMFALKVALNTAKTHVLVADGSNGLKIIDVSNPASPSLTSTLATSGSAFSILVQGNRAYVADRDGFRIIDITTITSATQIGSYNTGVSGWDSSISVYGNTAYLASEDFGLKILDITNPGSITLLGQMTNLGRNDIHVQAVGTNVFIAGAELGLLVLDASNPAASPLPTLAQYNTYGYATRIGYISGNYVYVASDIGGLNIINAAPYTVP